MGGIVSSIINIVFYTSTFAIGSVALFLFLTKPPSDNLGLILDEIVESKTMTDSLLKSVASKTLAYTVKDYVFFKTAEIKIPGGRSERVFGAFNKWVVNPRDFFRSETINISDLDVPYKSR
jgi:hypothetical protein